MKVNRFLMLVTLLTLMLLMAACGGGESSGSDSGEAAVAEESTTDEADTATEGEGAESADETSGVMQSDEATMPDRTPVRWYVGLGAGTDEATIAAQEAIVEEYNASQNEIELLLEIVDNDAAYDVLNTQIAAGNAPDIIGPMGIRGRASFPGAWLDLQGQIDKTNYDLSDFDPELVEFYQVEGEGQVGIPFAVFPSFVFFNKDLFDEAGLPYPPQAYGAPYVDENGDEYEWNMETVEMLAKKLTVDSNGNDATMDEFDPENIVQFGFGNMWTDIRGMATLFGAGNLVDEAGNAQFPDHWRDAVKWYHRGMWEDWFYPNQGYGDSEILGAGDWFQSGNIAMANSHLWYAACCTATLDDQWDIAVVPSYDGVTTAKLHADTFGIMKSSKNQDAAFEVLTWMLGEKAGELSAIYGGMPARQSLQDAYFATLAEQFPAQEINWEVARESLAYPDRPSHEEAMPAFLEASDRYNEFGQLLANDPDMDVDAEIDNLVNDLQRIFDAAGG